MKEITRLFLSFIFAVSTIAVFSATGSAQIQTAYQFLEVIDSNQQPVANAEVLGVLPGSAFGKTDEAGKFRIEFIDIAWRPLKQTFTIAKLGYYPFNYYGELEFKERRIIKIELLKIPKTKKEYKALGKRQLKRDFISASYKGDEDKVRELLELGISPNLSTGDLKGITFKRNMESVPAIAFPVILGHGAVTKLLFEKGVDLPKVKNNPNRGQVNVDKSNVLYHYIRSDYTTRADVKDSKGAFVLQNKDREKLLSKLRKEWDEGLKALIQAGADLNQKYYDFDVRRRANSTPLMMALDRNHLNAAKMLITSGSDVNAKDKQGVSALMIVKGIARQYRGREADVTYINQLDEIIKLLESAGAK